MTRANRRGGAAAIVLAVVALAGCTVNPVTGENQLDLMGESQELALGAQLYPRYTQQSFGEIPDPGLQTYVDEIGQRLAAAGHRPQIPWEFNAVNDPSINAYALPGGKVSITRGLLSRMGSEDELAAVLGHETGHVTARHSAQQYTRQMLTQLAMVGAAVYMEVEEVENRQLYLLGGMFGAQLALAHYSREQERQSDELGFDYMVATGHNPQGMVDLMQTLQAGRQRQPSLTEQWFSSHPMTSERIESARARLAQAPPEVRSRPLETQRFMGPTSRVRRQREAYDRMVEAQRLLAGDGQEAKARRLMQQSVDEWREDGLLRIVLATVLARDDRMRPALAAAAAARDDAPDIFVVQTLAAQIFMAEERWSPALSALERADTILPEIPQVRYLSGRCLEEMGRRHEAAEAYLWVARAVPDSELGQDAAARYRRLAGT